VRVLFDDQIFARQARGGASRYFVELIGYLHSQDAPGVEVVRPWRWTPNIHALEAGLGRSLPTRLGRRRQVVQLANRLQRGGPRPDVVHHTYYDPRYLGLQPEALRVVSVYDMIPEIHPELFPRGNPHEGKRTYVEAADLVLCISASTRDDLLRIYGRPSAKVVVTPLGVDTSFRPGLPRPSSVPDSYVLFVGQRPGYKDFDVLLAAFRRLSSRHPDLHLVVVGGGSFGPDDNEAIAARGLSDRVHQLTLSDDELAAAYAHATCFVFPSRYEGFGLPTLEAMACGCPAVLANSSSHPEVGGDAAVYFPPGDEDALVEAMEALVVDPDHRSERAAASIERAAQFSWKQTGAGTLRAYRDAMDGSA
jgi:glycosyltransferase involved in cell wall biosynthesis